MAWNALGSAQEKNVHSDYAREQSKRLREASVQDEVDDDAIVDELTNSAEKKRRLTVEQVKFLELSFNADLKLEPERKALIAKQLGLRPRQVAIWFQNRRARWKNKQLEQDHESLKAEHEAVLKENQSLLKENESIIMENKKLKDEVARLTALLQTVKRNDMADPIDDMVTSRLTGRDMGELKEEQVSGKSDLTSPSKLSDEQSEMQDSGQSYLTCEEGVAIAEPALGELNSALACSALKFEVECPPLYMADEILFNPLLFQQLAANGVCLEDACSLLFNLEDQLHGLAWGG